MKDTQALRPTIMNIPSFKKEETTESINDEEKFLGVLGNTKGWEILRDFARQAMSELDLFNSEAIANGQTFEEIGKNTVIISLAKEIVQRIISKVEDAREATNGK
jgi:hypothetical protein